MALVARRGEVPVAAIGPTAIGGSEAMRRDTLFRIASLTKPVAAAAAMILVGERVLRLDEPVDVWLPEPADRQRPPAKSATPTAGRRLDAAGS